MGQPIDGRVLAFSPDGARIYAAPQHRNFLEFEKQQPLAVLDAATGDIVHSFNAFGTIGVNEILSVALSPDGTRLVTGSSGELVTLWDAANYEIVRQFYGHTGSIGSVAFSSDGMHVVSGSEDGSVRLWDVASGDEIQRFELYGEGLPSPVAVLSPDETGILVWKRPGLVGSVVQIDIATGNEVVLFEPVRFEELLSGVSFSSDRTQAAVAVKNQRHHHDHSVLIFDTATGSLNQKIERMGPTARSLAFSPDGTRVVAILDDNSLKQWNVSNPEVQPFVGHTDRVGAVAFSPDGSHVVSGSNDQSIRLWDVASGNEVRQFSGHSAAVFSVALSPNGSQLVSGSNDQSIRLWDVASGNELRQFSGHDAAVTSVAFSPNGSQLVSGSNDQSIRLWDVASGNEVRQFSGHSAAVFSVALSPNGSQLVSGSNDQSIRLWDVASGNELRQFSGHNAAVTSVAFSPNGSQLVSGSYDESIHLWDVASGELLHVLSEHNAAVTSVAFSPNGSVIASGALDNTVRLFDASTGSEMTSFGHADDVLSVAISPDGTLVASASQDNSVWLWGIPTAVHAMNMDMLPTGIMLDQNFPNPFNPTTTIGFDIPEPGHVSLRVFDALGRHVITLLNSFQTAGHHEIRFRADGLASGFYFYQLRAGSTQISRAMHLMK